VVTTGSGMVNTSRARDLGRVSWTQYDGQWQQVDGLCDGGLFVDANGIHYVHLWPSHVLCRCTATDNVITMMNLIVALGYRVTVNERDGDGFPIGVSGEMDVPRAAHQAVQLGTITSGTMPARWTSDDGTTRRGNTLALTIARLVLEYESPMDRGRCACGLFDRVPVMVGIRTNIGAKNATASDASNRRQFDGFFTDGGNGMFIHSTSTGQIQHVTRPGPLRCRPRLPSALNSANALRALGYTVCITRPVAGNGGPFAASARIWIPRWKLLKALSTELPQFVDC
jgi:hypothetical protein